MPPAAASGGKSVRRDVLDLYLSDTRQLFNSMDPSPFRERDLDPDAATYVVDWAGEVSQGRPLGLVVHLGSAPSAADAALVRESIHEFFQRRAAATRRRLKRLLRFGRFTLLIALAFLGFVVVVADRLAVVVGDERYASLIEHGFVIGAWVALWRPLEIFLYDWWPIRAEARLYDRLGAMDVSVIHRTEAASTGADRGTP